MYKPSRIRGPIVSHNENYVAFISKPPKPPSWRDFLPDAKDKSGKNSSIDFTDLNLVQRSNATDPIETSNSMKLESMSVNAGVHPGIAVSKHNQTISATSAISMGPSEKLAQKQRKKTKARIHRTRSHMTISDAELPSEVPTGNMAISLANSKSREFGLKKKNVFDDRVYLDDNNRRCQRWLASLEECAPLEDVAFAQGTGVELVIPEETFSNTRLSPVTSESADDSENNCDKMALLPDYAHAMVQRSASPADHAHGQPEVATTDTLSSLLRERTLVVLSSDDRHGVSSQKDVLSPVEEVELNLPGMSSMNIAHKQTKIQKYSQDSAISHL